MDLFITDRAIPLYSIDYTRGDSMIWDFKGRRPLSAKDHVVSMKDGL